MKRRILSQSPPFIGARYVAARTNLRGWVVLDTASNRTLVSAGTPERAMEMARELSNQELEKYPLARPRPPARPLWIRRVLDRLFRRSEGSRVVAKLPRTIPAHGANTTPDSPTVEPTLPRADPGIAPVEAPAVGKPARETNHPRSETSSRRPSDRRTPCAEGRRAPASQLPGRRAPDVQSAALPKRPLPISLSLTLANGIRSTKPSVRREARIRLLEACLPAGATWHSEGSTAGFRLWIEDGSGRRLHEIRRKSLDAALLRLIQETG
jgi:hypothetical protein